MTPHNIPYEKVGKNEPVSIADEVPFEIPESWEWCRCSTLGAMVRGKGIKRTETVADGFPCVRYGEIYTSYNLSFDKTISFIPEEVDKNCNHFGKNDIIFTLTGENKPDIAKAVVYAGEDKVAAGGDMAYWTCHGMNPYYLMYFLNSPYAIELKRRTATGDIIVHISTDKIGNFLIPVPPLSEQQRIIDKIHEVEPLINNYKRKSEKIDSTNTAFPELLKKSILQEAIKGKLVPQDENDEPASVLLERIRVEKQRLVSEGKLKKDKHESIIYRRNNSHYEKLDGVEQCIDDEIPFDIPESWRWMRLGSLIQIESGKGLTSKEMRPGNIPVYGGNGITGYHNTGLVTKETVVIGRVGFYCGSVHVTVPNAWVTDNAFIVTYPETCIYRDYLVHTLKYMNLGKNNNATAQPVVSGKKIYPMLIPIPPYEEQKRIATQLDIAFQACDSLTH